MSNVPPNISIDDWFDFFDNCADATTRQRIESAVVSHAPSREIWESLRLSTSNLRDEARRLQSMAPYPEASLDSAYERLIARLHGESDAVLAPVRLEQVASLLTPWCGRRVAAALVLAAVARTSAGSSDKLWPCFLEQVETLTSALCGGAAARLTVEFGRSLA